MTAYAKNDGAHPGQLGLLPGFEGHAAKFHETPYEAVRRLLNWLETHWLGIPNFGRWVDCCAGRGAIPHHVGRYLSTTDSALTVARWHLVEMRDELKALKGIANASRIESPCRIQDAVGDPHGMFVGLTNLPWYATTINVVEAFWSKYPASWLIGLLCTQFCKDGARPDWYDQHMPEYILRLGGRFSFAEDGSKYPHPIEWNIWRPSGQRGNGRVRVLTAANTSG